jgi:hypothetical protein
MVRVASIGRRIGLGLGLGFGFAGRYRDPVSLLATASLPGKRGSMTG